MKLNEITTHETEMVTGGLFQLLIAAGVYITVAEAAFDFYEGYQSTRR